MIKGGMHAQMEKDKKEIGKLDDIMLNCMMDEVKLGRQTYLFDKVKNTNSLEELDKIYLEYFAGLNAVTPFDHGAYSRRFEPNSPIYSTSDPNKKAGTRDNPLDLLSVSGKYFGRVSNNLNYSSRTPEVWPGFFSSGFDTSFLIYSKFLTKVYNEDFNPSSKTNNSIREAYKQKYRDLRQKELNPNSDQFKKLKELADKLTNLWNSKPEPGTKTSVYLNKLKQQYKVSGTDSQASKQLISAYLEDYQQTTDQIRLERIETLIQLNSSKVKSDVDFYDQKFAQHPTSQIHEHTDNRMTDYIGASTALPIQIEKINQLQNHILDLTLSLDIQNEIKEKKLESPDSKDELMIRDNLEYVSNDLLGANSPNTDELFLAMQSNNLAVLDPYLTKYLAQTNIQLTPETIRQITGLLNNKLTDSNKFTPEYTIIALNKIQDEISNHPYLGDSAKLFLEDVKNGILSIPIGIWDYLSGTAGIPLMLFLIVSKCVTEEKWRNLALAAILITLIVPILFFGAVESITSEIAPAIPLGIGADGAVVDSMTGGAVSAGGIGSRSIVGLASRETINSVTRGGSLLNSTTIGTSEALETAGTLRLGLSGLNRVSASSRTVSGNLPKLIEKGILPKNTTLIQEGFVTVSDKTTSNGAVFRAYRTSNQTITNLTRELNLEAKLKPNLQTKTPTNQSQIEGITRNYKPSKSFFEIVKETPSQTPKLPQPKKEIVAKANKQNIPELNIKPEEPSQLDKFRNKLNELRERLMGEKPKTPSGRANEFPDIPCLASNQLNPNDKPFDVAIGLVEVAEAKISPCTKWEKITNSKLKDKLKQISEVGRAIQKHSSRTGSSYPKSNLQTPKGWSEHGELFIKNILPII